MSAAVSGCAGLEPRSATPPSRRTARRRRAARSAPPPRARVASSALGALAVRRRRARARGTRRATTSSHASSLALVAGVERAEPLDLVAEQVDAHRRVGGRAPDVDDAAAHRDLAAVLDAVLAAVAVRDERGRAARRARRRRRCARRRAARAACLVGRCIRARTEATTTRGRRSARRQPPPRRVARAHRRRPRGSRARTAACPTPAASTTGRPSRRPHLGRLAEEAREVAREPLGVERRRCDDEERRSLVRRDASAARTTALARRGRPRPSRPARSTRTAGSARSASVSAAERRRRRQPRGRPRRAIAASSPSCTTASSASAPLEQLVVEHVALRARRAATAPSPRRGPWTAACRCRRAAVRTTRCRAPPAIERRPLWPASPPPSFSCSRPGVEVELVVHDEQPAEVLDARRGARAGRPRRRTRSCTSWAPPRGRGGRRASASASRARSRVLDPQRRAVARRELLDDRRAEVVPRVAVLDAGVGEPDDDPLRRRAPCAPRRPCDGGTRLGLFGGCLRGAPRLSASRRRPAPRRARRACR